MTKFTLRVIKPSRRLEPIIVSLEVPFFTSVDHAAHVHHAIVIKLSKFSASQKNYGYFDPVDHIFIKRRYIRDRFIERANKTATIQKLSSNLIKHFYKNILNNYLETKRFELQNYWMQVL